MRPYDSSHLRNGKLYEPSQDLFNKMLSPQSHSPLQASAQFSPQQQSLR